MWRCLLLVDNASCPPVSPKKGFPYAAVDRTRPLRLQREGPDAPPERIRTDFRWVENATSAVLNRSLCATYGLKISEIAGLFRQPNLGGYLSFV